MKSPSALAALILIPAAARVIPAAGRPETFFRGFFELPETGDTYLDMSGWKKGIVWINGRNLGRNEIVVFDLRRTVPAEIRGFKSLE